MTNASDQLTELSNTLQSAISIILIAAIVTVCFVEIFKLPLRGITHWFIFRLWASNLLRNSEKTVDALKLRIPGKWDRKEEFFVAFPIDLRKKLRGGFFLGVSDILLPSSLFLKKIENLSQAALDQPFNSPGIELFTSGAKIESIESFLHYAQRETSIGGKRQKTKLDSEMAESSVAQSNLISFVERNLDDLQIKIAFIWPIVVRISAVLIAISFLRWISWNAICGPIAGKQPLNILITFGIVAGFVSSVLYDTLALLRSYQNK